VKLVNFSPAAQNVSLRLAGLPAGGALAGTAQLLSLGSQDPLQENSFQAPNQARGSRQVHLVLERVGSPAGQATTQHLNAYRPGQCLCRRLCPNLSSARRRPACRAAAPWAPPFPSRFVPSRLPPSRSCLPATAQPPPATPSCPPARLWVDLQVAPVSSSVSGVGEQFQLPLGPWSLTIIDLSIAPPSA